MIAYRHQDFVYESFDGHADDRRTDRSKKDYSRGRSIKSMRKRARGRTSFKGESFSHRRNKRVAC